MYAFDGEESGIKRVVQAYAKFGPKYGIEYVVVPASDQEAYDLIAVHAGTFPGRIPSKPMVAHVHGLYWSADYYAARWEYHANGDVIGSARYARQITVPSRWVQETFQRDMRISPTIVPHGIEWQDWQEKCDNGGYVLWNKNRDKDVCDPTPITHLAYRFPKTKFVSTYAPGEILDNMQITGMVDHAVMKHMVQGAAVYLSTTKETFGIGVLEAMAAGIPVLGFAHGGNLDLVQHGVNGYLAQPDNLEDLADGLAYCLEYRDMLGANGKEMAKQWTWDNALELVREVYDKALAITFDEDRPSVIDPTWYEAPNDMADITGLHPGDTLAHIPYGGDNA